MIARPGRPVPVLTNIVLVEYIFFMKVLFHACLVAALLAVASPSLAVDQLAPSSPKEGSDYTLTVIPFYSPEKIWTKFAPLVEYLKKTTGQPWELKLYHNHEALLDGLCSGEVAFALLGPVPLGRALDRCSVGITAVALGKDGKPFFRSVILTGDPTVKSIADIKGKRFALFKGATAAHIIPLKMLADSGITEADLAPIFYEGQDRIMTALMNREVSGAGVKETLYLKFKKGPLRALKTSDPLPGYAVASAPRIREAAAKQLAGALTRLDPRNRHEDLQLMQDWDDEVKNGFIVPPATYRASVLNILSVYREIMHEAR